MINWFRKRNIFETPPYWKTFKSLFADGPEKSTKIEHLQFSVLDLETTGLNTEKDKILSAGVVKIKHLEIKIQDTFECFVYQDAYDRASAPIHGITRNQSQTGLDEEEFLKKIIDILGNDIIVGHHIGFDIAMLNRVSKRLTGEKLPNTIIDTAQLYQRCFPRVNYGLYIGDEVSLDEMAEKFRIKKHDRHSAIGDAMITALAFLRLAKIMHKKGITTYKDLTK